MKSKAYRAIAVNQIHLGRYRPEAPTDPYVLALEHTVLQITGLAIAGSWRGGHG